MTRFLRDLLSVDSPRRVRQVKIDSGERDESSSRELADTESRALDAALRRRVVSRISWFISFAFVLSLAGVIVAVVLDRAIPEILSNVFFATLGYLGGAFGAFMRIGEQSQ